jgi:CheY-like chemotaxis protein
MKVHFVPTTSQALELIKGNEYDVVISDMSRPEGERAGYDLLARIKLLRPAIPLILPSNNRRLRRRGHLERRQELRT